MIEIDVRIESDADGKWPPLYDHLRGAHDADEVVPVSFGALPDMYSAKVLSWSRMLDQTSATFRMVAKPWSIILDGVPGETITRTL